MNEQSSKINQILGEATVFEQNFILPRKMAAAVTGMSNDLGVDGKVKRGTEIRNGLASPEPTPGVEDGRIDADKARQAAEAAASGSTDQVMGEADDDEGDGDYNPGGGSDEEEREARKRVMSCDSKNYRQILGVKETYANPVEEKTVILDAYRDLGALIHPDFSDDDNAEIAFTRVKKAAKKLGVEKKYLEEVEDWDGKTGFPEVEFSEEAPKDELLEPSNAIQEIYKEAPPHLEKLFMDSTDMKALGGLRALNEKIKTQNGKDGVTPAERWTINLGNLGTHYNSAKPLFDRLLKDELDEEAKQGLENIRAEMTKSYPDIFLVPIPTPENRAEQTAAAERAAGKAAADKAAADKTAADKTAADKVTADKTAADKAAADKATADKATADNAAAKKFGNIEFPWVTYPLPTGERIIAGRQRTKDDVAGSLCCVELPCTDPEDPNFEFRDDIDIFELQKYFATPGIKLMGETDEMGRPVKVWRKVDRKDFREFKFCVVAKRERSDLRNRTKPVCPEVLCGVVMADGVNVLNKTGLLNMVGKKAEEGYIRRYCEKKGITSPWDVKPNSWTIANEDKELLDKLKSERLNSASAGNSEIKTEKVDAMEKINTSGSSLDSTLKKMEERMASMETKLAKVDELGTNVANITLLVQQLMQQAGLNATSG